jgi:integrase
MAKFNFNLRNPKSDSETPIFLVCRWSNKRLVYPTQISISPKFWDFETQRAIRTMKFPNHPQTNIALGKMLTTCEGALLEFKFDNESNPSIEDVRNSFDKALDRKVTEQPETMSFYKFISKFIEESKGRINNKTGKPFAIGTINSYNQCLSVLKDYDPGQKLNFESIDLDFYHNFKLFLSKRGLKPNTIAKHFKKLKTFLNDATERGYNTNKAYKSKRFVVAEVVPETIYLSETELTELASLDLQGKPRLERVRDLFLVGCWTGLRFSDFSTLTKDNFKDDLIEITTQKTKETVIIPIYPIVSEIMHKYNGQTANSLPLPYSNVKMNLYLKELGQFIPSLNETVKINTILKGKEVVKEYHRYELLTCHTARRSFATNLYIDGFPSITIMKITGHKTEKAFMRYIRVTPKEHARLLQSHWKKKFSVQNTE